MISALRALCAVLLVVLPGAAHAQAWCNNGSVCNSSWTRREHLVFNDVDAAIEQS